MTPAEATEILQGVTDEDMEMIFAHRPDLVRRWTRLLTKLDDKEDIHSVLRRVCAAQPPVFLKGHEGYYRHADIAALICHVRAPDPVSLDGQISEAMKDPAWVSKWGKA